MSALLYSPTGSSCFISSFDKWRKDEVLQLLSNMNGQPFCEDSVYFVLNGRLVDSNQQEMTISDKDVLRVHSRLVGGKGGFGSMLRAIGAQIEKTTSREACRDLSGRRMRDVNDEKKITEWVAKQADRERELAKQKQERLEKRRAMPKHNFDDQTYTKEIQKNLERIDDALKQGLKASTSTSTTTSATKRKGPDRDEIPKKRKMWMDEELDDSDEEFNTSSIAGPSTSSTSTHTSTSTSIDTVLTEPGPSSSKHSSEQESEPLKKTSPTPESTQTSSSSSNADEDEMVKGVEKDDKTEEKTKENKPFCLDDYKSAEELESIGLDALKDQLMGLGLKCGGTLQERALRLFSTKGKSLDKLDPALFAKPSKGKKKQKKK